MSIAADFKNAFRKRNNGLIQIIILNVVAFLTLLLLKVILVRTGNTGIFVAISLQLHLPPDILDFLHRPWTLLIHFFIHDDSDFFHILFNMILLYQFGKLLDEYLGNRRLMSIYFLGAIAGGLLYLLCYNTIPYLVEQQDKVAGLRGASAGVFAVMIAAATLMPDYTFFLFLIGPVRIKYIVGFLLLFNFIQNAMGQQDGRNIAHIGGAMLGYVYIMQLRKGHDLAAPFRNLGRRVQNAFKRKPKIKVSYRNTVPETAGSSFPTEDEVDRILDKISRSGYESLTKEEKQVLFHASQKN